MCLPSLLSQYEKHLDEAASRAGWRPENAKPASERDASKVISNKGPGLPFAPPSVGSFTLPKAAAPANRGIAGFVPNLPAGPSSSSPFSFNGVAAPKAPEPVVQPSAKKSFVAVTELIDEVMADEMKGPQSPKAPSPSLFSTSIRAGTPEPNKTASLFSFAPSGPLHKTTPESKSFSPSLNVQAASPPAGLGRFGPGGSTPQLAFGGAKASAPGAPAATSNHGFGRSQTSFSFGSSTAKSSSATASIPAFSFAAKPTEDMSKAATPSFVFGAAQSVPFAKPNSSPFSFPSKAASDGPQPAATGFSSGSDRPSFAFSTPTETAGPSRGSSPDDPVEGTPEPVTASKNLAETDGPGEEKEETVIELRGKLYYLEAGNFALAGLGQFKLKRSNLEVNEKRKRRLLLRTDGGGNVVLVSRPSTRNLGLRTCRVF